MRALQLLLVAGTLPVAGAVRADDFRVTYEAAGVQNTTAGFDHVGVETFDSRATGYGRSFTTDFGTGSVITGAYADVWIISADRFGGAGGTGRYAATFSGTGYQVSLSTADAAGINYFGYWLSALDAGNRVSFYRGDDLLYQFNPDNVLTLIGNQSAYRSNPNSGFRGQNAGEPYVFLNFFDTNGTFDRVVFQEVPARGGYESDNHTVGYYNSIGRGVFAGGVPEPDTWAMPVSGFGLVGMTLRRRPAVTA